MGGRAFSPRLLKARPAPASGKGGGELGLLVLGLASLCNHSEEPNTETRYEHDPDLGWVVLLTATRVIREGEELTRRYACAPWFQTAA